MRRVCNSRFLRNQTVVVVVLLLAMALLSGTAAASAPLGSITEFETTNPETGTQPSGIATGPDQNIWFADDDGATGDRARDAERADDEVYGRPHSKQPAARDRAGTRRQYVVHR